MNDGLGLLDGLSTVGHVNIYIWRRAWISSLQLRPWDEVQPHPRRRKEENLHKDMWDTCKLVNLCHAHRISGLLPFSSSNREYILSFFWQQIHRCCKFCHYGILCKPRKDLQMTACVTCLFLSLLNGWNRAILFCSVFRLLKWKWANGSWYFMSTNSTVSIWEKDCWLEVVVVVGKAVVVLLTLYSLFLERV